MKQYQKLMYAVEFKITLNEEIEGTYSKDAKRKAIEEIKKREEQLDKTKDHVLLGTDEETYMTWKNNYQKMIEIINTL